MRLFGLELKRAAKEAPPRRRLDIPKVRNWDAAESSRLYSDWTLDRGYEAWTVSTQWPTMVGRSREQAKNNPWVRKIVSMFRTNVVGDVGLRLRCQALNPTGVPDTLACREIEAAWLRWCNEPAFCDAAGRKTFRDICDLAVTSLIRDGEAILRLLPGFGWPENPFAFSVKALDPVSLDVNYVQDADAGVRIYNGVQVNEWGRAVLYHFRKDFDRLTYSNKLYTTVSGEHVALPADEIVHVFQAEWEDQFRGIPWLYSTLPLFRMVAGYSEAELVAAREDACSTGHYQIATGVEYDPGDTYDQLRDQVREMAPGEQEVLPEGVTHVKHSPTRPNTAYNDFVKAQLRAGASGALVDYNTLANDLEGVSYSSIRQGVLSERDVYRSVQQLLASHLCRRVYRAWLQMYLSSGQSLLPVSKLEKFAAHKWQGRRWQWVDPYSDARTAELQRRYGWKTDAEICDEIGGNWEDNAAEVDRLEQAAAGTYLETNYAPQPTNAGGPAAADAGGNTGSQATP